MLDKKIIGASGRIKVTEDDRGNIVIDIDETYAGQVSINRLGTVKEGKWEGETITSDVGGTNLNNNGTFSFSGDTVITGSILIDCNPELQTSIKILDNGTMALQEQTLQIANAFSEFNQEQKQQAFDNIAPTLQHGDMITKSGKNNVRIKAGAEDQFLGIDEETGLPQYKALPPMYSFIRHTSTYTIDFLKERPCLSFDSDGFKVVDDEMHDITSVSLDQRLNDFVNCDKEGLLVTTKNPKEDNQFEARKLLAGNFIHIENPDFILGDPIISLSQYYCGQTSIDTLGKVKTGEWNAKEIEPKFGGTGCVNRNRIIVDSNGPIEFKLPFQVKSATHFGFGAQGEYLNIVVDIEYPSFGRGIDLAVRESGTVATLEKTLQKERNLKDVQSPKEAFRFISPTTSKGDIIVHGCGDYNEPLKSGPDNCILVADSTEDLGLAYKHPKDIPTLNIFIKTCIENALKNFESKYDELLMKYHQYENVVSKMLDNIYAQFDYLSQNKQMRIMPELESTFKSWAEKKTKSTNKR